MIVPAGILAWVEHQEWTVNTSSRLFCRHETLYLVSKPSRMSTLCGLIGFYLSYRVDDHRSTKQVLDVGLFQFGIVLLDTLAENAMGLLYILPL